MRLMWFRTDYRVADNPALCHSRRDNQEPTLAITFLPEKQWQQHGLGERRINLNKCAVNNLYQSLDQLGIPLLILPCADFAHSQELLFKLLLDQNISELNFNIEYELNERRRDHKVNQWCKEQQIEVNRFHDQCLVPPGELATKDGRPFRVYSPFRKAWLKRVENQPSAPLAAPAPQAESLLPEGTKQYWADNLTLPETQPDSLWEASEDAAHNQLEVFLNQDAYEYHNNRNDPGLNATSRLSFHMALGLVSSRQCIYSAWQTNACQLMGGEKGLEVWINELVWREFYRHLTVAYPDLCKHQAFKPEVDSEVQWRDSEEDFTLWCEAKTGYPIVDAAIKQLLDQGWMHNRLRMIVAMFLTKHLLIDWRKGEAFFNQHLVDADFASNNGGWQWSSSTGADGAPYFRIFNPTTQSEKFDAAGHFLTHYLPELAQLPEKARHNPSSMERLICNYPEPIVEHSFARQRALDAFKQPTDTDCEIS